MKLERNLKLPDDHAARQEHFENTFYLRLGLQSVGWIRNELRNYLLRRPQAIAGGKHPHHLGRHLDYARQWVDHRPALDEQVRRTARRHPHGERLVPADGLGHLVDTPLFEEDRP